MYFSLKARRETCQIRCPACRVPIIKLIFHLGHCFSELLYLEKITNGMKKTIGIVCCLISAICISSCKENYSNGEKVGNLIEFTSKGVFWDSWEGRMNMTQTGMNTSGEPFSFSFDNDRHDQDSLINLMKQAQVEGWKLKIRYHEVWGLRNCFYNRGETDYFVDDVTVLDKDFANPLRNLGTQPQGSVVDTVWVVIDKSEVLRRMKK